MKQLFQSVKTGESSVLEVPSPALKPGHVLVRNAASLVSAGTERMVVEFAEKNLFQKAQARPDLVRQVADKARREGILNTLEAVRSRLDQPLSLGYSSAGTVMSVGEGITDIQVGDRVACSGMNYASHAEIVSVPRMLVTPIPSDQVSFEDAAFTTVGAIALHGIRLAGPGLGETVAVIGLGLIGQLTVQILKAAGCLVLGMDLDSERCRTALGSGCDATAESAEELESLVSARTRGRGADSVLITAAASGNGPVDLAGRVARARAVIVAVGAVGMELPRKTYYEKELDFRISRSYGPGRYDPEYEEKGRDYPISYVRWTESRNMESFLNLISDQKVKVRPLISHRFQIDQAVEAYDLITGKNNEPFLGVLIQYPQTAESCRRIDLRQAEAAPSSTVRVGVMGAGNFAGQVLLPAMQKAGGTEFAGVCTASGGSGRRIASKFGFGFCTTDEQEILSDSRINAVLVATRHDQHGRQVVAGLGAGKHVFCEKPLCLTKQELQKVVEVVGRTDNQLLMVGYNRRFAAMAIAMKQFFNDARTPLAVSYRINAGSIPANHWVNDPEVGGGRIIGEVCHFVDFLMFVTGALPVSVYASALPNSNSLADSVAVNLTFSDGSIGTINYVAEGDRAYGKERVEVIGGGRVAVLDDFRSLELIRDGKRSVMKARMRQDKGHVGEWKAFADAIRAGSYSPISMEEIVTGTLATFSIEESLRARSPITINFDGFLSGDSHE